MTIRPIDLGGGPGDPEVDPRLGPDEPDDREVNFAWIVEGYMTCGTLQQYADDVAEGHYSGHSVSASLWFAERANEVIEVTPATETTWTADDYSFREIYIYAHGQRHTAVIKIDLRA